MKKIKTIHLESVDSTNNYARDFILQQAQTPVEPQTQHKAQAKAPAKANALSLPLLVTADYQSAGRGRYGHSFLSPAGTGIYMSYAYQRDYTEEELLGVTTRVAELILPVLERHYTGHIPLQIKPINDIYIGNPADPKSRKIAGILTERIDFTPQPVTAIQPGYFIIVGIGINCKPFELPDELKEIVGFLEPDCSMDILIEEIAQALCEL